MAQLSDDCFAFGGRLVPIEDAARLLRERFRPVTDIESVRLAEAAGRVLAADLVAAMNVPRETNSAVDGYAVHFDDLAAGADTILKVQGRATAGHPMSAAVPRGHAARVFTGAMMPSGPDTVLMQEDCGVEGNEAGEIVRIPPGIKRGANRRLAGEDVSAGSIVLRAGRRLGPPEIGLAASLGTVTLGVRRRLRVALFSTGDEVAEPGTALRRGQIYDSNRAMVACLLARLGVAVTDGGILPDQAATLRAALHEASCAHDLIITSGGVSTGDEDHVRSAIEHLGALAFWRLGIKPGRPVAVGTIGDTALVGLPGNPVATMVTYMAIARPLIAALGAEVQRPLPRFSVTSGFAYRKKRDRREYVRVRLEPSPTGLVAQRFPREGAGILTSLTESDALVELPESMTELQPGQMVACLPLSVLYE
jgi:molybdopterin molybdotransferase